MWNWEKGGNRSKRFTFSGLSHHQIFRAIDKDMLLDKKCIQNWQTFYEENFRETSEIIEEFKRFWWECCEAEEGTGIFDTWLLGQ